MRPSQYSINLWREALDRLNFNKSAVQFLRALQELKIEVFQQLNKIFCLWCVK